MPHWDFSSQSRDQTRVPAMETQSLIHGTGREILFFIVGILQMVIAAMKLKDAYSLEGKL